MPYWLFKSEPETFSIDHLMKRPKQTEHWDGVRNYQARNFMRAMEVGDLGFFYHSNCTPPGIAGIIQVVKKAYPDFTAFDFTSKYYDEKSTEKNPRWFMVDVKFIQKFPHLITLDEIKATPALKNMQIVKRGNRLSITPVSPTEWKTILKLSN